MKIEIDGSPIKRPQYAARLPQNQYLEYLENTESQREHGWRGIWSGGSVGGRVDGDLLDRFTNDRNFYKHLQSVIRNGSEHHSVEFASTLADHLAQSGDLLELVPKMDGKVFTNNLVKEWEKRYSGNLDVATPQLGTFLEKGTLVFRGNVGEVSAVRGGTIFIDGDVNSITRCEEGIIYVTGNVNTITDSRKAIVVAAGEVKNYTQHRRSYGGLNKEVTPSPFVFTSHDLTVEEPDAWQGRDVRIPEAITTDISSSYVIAQDRLTGWLPEETRQKALELCNERIGSYLDDLKKLASGITDAKMMARFAKYNMYGYIEGNTSGYYKGTSDATPASRWD